MKYPVLAGLSPLQSTNALRIRANKPLETVDQNTELPSAGFQSGRTQMLQGITEGIMSALGQVAGAYTKHKADQRGKIEKEEDQKLEFDRLKKLAEIMRNR
jgi:hypothetical protein